jgi:hypothetical protein
MLNEPAFDTALRAAIARLLRPLVRLLLKHAFPYKAFEAMARRVYVDVAMNDFSLAGRKPSISRAAILTGLTRKDVQALLEERAADGAQAEPRQYNRAARVLTAWGREADFRSAAGVPLPLAMDGERGFAELVRRHAGDVPVRAVLDELLRVDAVRLLEDGRVQVQQRAFVPLAGIVQKIGILGTDVGELVATIAHNIEHGATDPRFQRKVMYEAIPLDVVPAFRALAAAQSQELLEWLDVWLAERDIDHHPGRAGRNVPTARVGVGIHYFEEESPA